MTLILRALTALLATCALALALAATPTPASAHAAEKAATPTVAFQKIDKDCSDLVVDGQEQEQCQADFTVKVGKVKKGYKVVVRQTSQYQPTLGSFTSGGTSASKRFKDVVVSYGAKDEPVKIKFRVVVKDANGKTVFTSKPRTF